VEDRATRVVFKFRICPFLYTVNITLSPTDLWSSIYEIRSSLLVIVCPSIAVVIVIAIMPNNAWNKKFTLILVRLTETVVLIYCETRRP
jgi:hypothetical protein